MNKRQHKKAEKKAAERERQDILHFLNNQRVPNKYILTGRSLRLAKNCAEWMQFFECIDSRRIAFDTVVPGVDVSTVFLSIDHGYEPDQPLLFETMTFSDREDCADLDQSQERYSTYDEALAGHAVAIAAVHAHLATIDQIDPSNN